MSSQPTATVPTRQRGIAMTRTRTAAAVAALVALVVTVAAAWGRDGTVEGRGYLTSSFDLDTSLAEMVAFPSNAIVVRGRVVGADPARWNTPDGAEPSVQRPMHYVFTPVRVRVTEVLAGSHLRAGQTFTTRRYDGKVGSVRFAEEHGASPLRPGRDVVLFLQAPQPLNDGRADLIANAVYVVDGDRLVSDGNVVGSMPTLVTMLAAHPR